MVYVTLTSLVVPYIGTWIETEQRELPYMTEGVVPYIGTWIETPIYEISMSLPKVVPYIGTWIETSSNNYVNNLYLSRTLYRYVD